MDQFETINVVSYMVAFGAGLVSFLSPCVLPVVPGYLSVITGLSASELEEGGRRHTLAILRDSLSFVFGLSVVFVLLGLTASGIGSALFQNQEVITRASGVLIFGMAVFMVGSVVAQAPWLYQEVRFHPDLGRYGRFAPPVAGAAFGFGWSPCLGPILGSVLGVAAADGRLAGGATLLGAYSLGLGVPFIATGLAFGKMTSAFDIMKRHLVAIVLASSVILAFFGLLMMMNQLTWLTVQLRTFLEAIGLDGLIARIEETA